MQAKAADNFCLVAVGAAGIRNGAKSRGSCILAMWSIFLPRKNPDKERQKIAGLSILSLRYRERTLPEEVHWNEMMIHWLCEI